MPRLLGQAEAGDFSWVLTLQRDWRQPAEHQPVEDVELYEYKEPDDHGFVAELRMMIGVGVGRKLVKTHRMAKGQYEFFLDAIARRVVERREDAERTR